MSATEVWGVEYVAEAESDQYILDHRVDLLFLTYINGQFKLILVDQIESI